MKILAVIPARAGSKGIPNKNIRLVCGRPLVAYAIRTALASSMIDDVVVSTDSPEVMMIARQLGASVHVRSADLCADDVTLDAVVEAACRGADADWVITMQPTSPTLRVETLDAAIRYCLEKQLDTVISVVNHPHLAWVERDGEIVPAYEKRLNRQYLPPYYLETGAFFISRGACVTPESRFGARVGVYQVSPEEAVDIDSYADLTEAAAIIEGRRVAIYVNGNNKRGVGHVYRALELADEFYAKPDIFYDVNQTSRALFGTTTHRLIPVDGIGELLPILNKNRYDIFINDILATSLDYMIAVRKSLPTAKIINFEDDGEGASAADLVFNALYSKGDMPQVRAGEKYYISSKLFLFYEPAAIRQRVERVFISFGGADPQNYSDRLLGIAMKEKYADVNFEVVLGRAKKNAEALAAGKWPGNIRVLHDVGNMPEIMSACDVGVTSRGRTGYELAMLGIPSMAMAQNHREEKHGFVCMENGFDYLGLNPDDAAIECALDRLIAMSAEQRLARRQLMLAHDLRGGRRRVMNLINSL